MGSQIMRIVTLLTFIIRCMLGNNFEDIDTCEVDHRAAKTGITHSLSFSRVNELMTAEGLTYGKAWTKEKLVCAAKS